MRQHAGRGRRQLILAGIILVLIALAYVAGALTQTFRLGISLRQALFYLPLKLIWRVSDGRIRKARNAGAPVIYAVAYQSQMDPALMLSLLPDDTLHILDEASAKSAWLEPYRELARTITFNASHVFVSRRLVRHLKGKGRLAVYFPETVEPDARTMRLYRAVSRIALKSGADVVPIFVGRSRFLPMSRAPESEAPRRRFPKLVVAALEPISLDAFANRGGRPPSSSANSLFDRIAEARVAAKGRPYSLFAGFSRAARRFGVNRIIVDDNIVGPQTYRQLMIGARVLGDRFAAVSSGGEAVGLMLPNSVAMATAFIGLQSAGCAAAMLNWTAGPANVTAAIRLARIRTVVSSRAFIEKAQIGDIVEAIEKAGARLIWLEEVKASLNTADKAMGALLWRWPHTRARASQTAVILFTSGSDAAPKGVLLSHSNILANVAQIEARIRFSPADTLMNVLPVFHSFGLTGGTILPLLSGVRLYLYPSPLHFKQIPAIASQSKPTIMFGTDTFLAAYARAADKDDFSNLRLVVAGAEPVQDQTRKVWQERFRTDIVEGYGLTEASPVVAVNTRSHSKPGSVGRLLPSVRVRLEPVDGIDPGGRLWISGPNVMRGYIAPGRPGDVAPPADGWHDTGDIVSFDADGYVTILGRSRRFAKIAGEMVSLANVEQLAHSLWPDARHAAVALPGSKRGERIVLVTSEGSAELAQLRKAAKAAGAAELSVPDRIVTVDAVPLLGTGKVDYITATATALAALNG
ncbi:MAG: AMP-binding protein [Mesorhizobium sp.]